MRKIILFLFISLLTISNATAQETKSKLLSGVTVYAELDYAMGICSSDLPLMYLAGAQKPIGKHWSFGADMQFMSEPYETYCCDVYSVGKYTTYIPSLKLNFDPGKRNKGFFIGIGL